MLLSYVLLALVLGAALGYGVAYTRYGNAKIIDEMRANFQKAQQELETKKLQVSEYGDQNKILKQKAQHLLNQNEDFSKMVSELTRYYYRIKQGSEKLKELVDIMDIYDEAIENKLDRIIGDERNLDMSGIMEEDSTKKYF